MIITNLIRTDKHKILTLSRCRLIDRYNTFTVSGQYRVGIICVEVNYEILTDTHCSFGQFGLFAGLERTIDTMCTDSKQLEQHKLCIWCKNDIGADRRFIEKCSPPTKRSIHR